MKVGKQEYEIIGVYLMCNENLFIRIDSIKQMDIKQESVYSGGHSKWHYVLRLWNSDGKLIHSTNSVPKPSELIELVKMIANHSEEDFV